MDLHKNYYNILGLTSSASEDDIRKSYRKLAVAYHPDKNNGDKASEEKFKDISDAYQVLKDANQKNIYDVQSPHGKNYTNSGFSNFGGFGGFGGFNPFGSMNNDYFFSSIFNQQFGGFNAGTRRGNEQFNERLDIEVNVTVTFSQVYSNSPIPISYKRYVSCDRCNGSGFDPDSESYMCEICDGNGKNIYEFRRVLGIYLVSEYHPVNPRHLRANFLDAGK